MTFYNELLIAFLLLIYGLFINITYKISIHYINKLSNIRDFIFWLLHTIIFIIYYDNICNMNFRFYSLLFLFLGFLLGMRYFNFEENLNVIDNIINRINKILAIIYNNLFYSNLEKNILLYLLKIIKSIRNRIFKHKKNT